MRPAGWHAGANPRKKIALGLVGSQAKGNLPFRLHRGAFPLGCDTRVPVRPPAAPWRLGLFVRVVCVRDIDVAGGAVGHTVRHPTQHPADTLHPPIAYNDDLGPSSPRFAALINLMLGERFSVCCSELRSGHS